MGKGDLGFHHFNVGKTDAIFISLSCFSNVVGVTRNIQKGHGRSHLESIKIFGLASLCKNGDFSSSPVGHEGQNCLEMVGKESKTLNGPFLARYETCALLF